MLDDVVIDTEKMTFPDFLIFVSRRKSGNGVLKLFDEYDKGQLLSIVLNFTEVKNKSLRLGDTPWKLLLKHIINYNLSDGSHRLDKYEVQYWLENHGKYITIRQAQKIIDQMDFNGDGMIEYDDFLATILGTWLEKLRILIWNLF